MEISLSTAGVFVMGAFVGALVGRMITFGILALCLLIMLIKV
jgi:hypothetical protein